MRLCPFTLWNNSVIHYVQLPALLQPPYITLSPARCGAAAHILSLLGGGGQQPAAVGFFKYCISDLPDSWHALTP